MDRVYKLYLENTIGNDYICGDLHGNYEQLMAVLEHLSFNKDKDRLFCVGDLTDRGSNNIKTMSLIYEPWFAMVKGNHEVMLEHGFFYNADNNGTKWAYDIITGDNSELKETYFDYIDQVKTLPLTIEIETKHGYSLGIVHAQSEDSWYETIETAIDSFEAQKSNNSSRYIYEDVTTWSRHVKNYFYQEHYKNNPVDGVQWCFHGHSIMIENGKPKAKILGNRVFLDTGFFAGNSKDAVGVLSVYDVNKQELNEVMVDFKENKVINRDVTLLK